MNMITSTVANKYAAVKSFGSISILGLSSFFFWKIEKRWKTLKYLFPAQKKLVFLQQALSLILSWFLPVLKFQMKVHKKKFLLMN